jgi:hypothetical protein
VTVSDRTLRKVDTESFDWSSQSVAKESVSNFNAPDYLIDITSRIKAHPDADLVVIRANYPNSQFDGNGDYRSDQAWRLLAYDWTDVNHDHKLWTDANGDGIVDHRDLNTSSNIDGFNDIDFKHSEMEQGEYERFFYHRPGSNILEGFVRRPAERMADGIFIGFQHSAKNPRDRQDVVQDPDRVLQERRLELGLDDAGVGQHVLGDGERARNGAVRSLRGSGRRIEGRGEHRRPGHGERGGDRAAGRGGNFTGTLTFGGPEAASAQSDQLYDNGSFFGANDWTWRDEAGDWRFFYYDVTKTPPAGTLFLADTTWDDVFPTDLDTLVMGRSPNSYQLIGGSTPIYAPYALDTVGKSPKAYLGNGTWRFNTATGGAEDLVAAPAQEGLNAIVTHGVDFNGDKFDVPFKVTVGAAKVAPTSVTQSTSSDTGSFDVTFSSSVDLAGLRAEAFGLSQPTSTTETARQDDPNDPSTASVKRNFTIGHASQATFTTDLAANDLDLYVLYDANKDGQFTASEIVGSSTSSSGVESVRLVAPPDGNYQVWLHGFSVTGTPSFHLASTIIQGNDLTVSGLPSGTLPAGTPVTIHVAFSKAMTPGQSYLGQLLLGPPTAPRALSVPITITRTP